MSVAALLSLLAAVPIEVKDGASADRLRQIERECSLKQGTLEVHGASVWIQNAQEQPTDQTNCAVKRLYEAGPSIVRRREQRVDKAIAQQPNVASAATDDWPPAMMNEYPVQRCGLRVSAPQADLDRIQALATKSGYLVTQGSPAKLVIGFPAGSDPKAAGTFTKQLETAERLPVKITKQCLPPLP